MPQQGSIFTQFFPDSRGEKALPKGAWMLQQRLIFTPLFFQILGVRKPFQKELGCPNRDRFLHTFFPDSRDEEAVPKGAWMLQQGLIFIPLFSRF